MCRPRNSSFFYGVFTVQLLALFGFAQSTHEAYIVQRDPSGIGVFDNRTGNRTASIPLEARPRVAQFDIGSKSLYIIAEELPAIPPGRDRESIPDTGRYRLLVIDALARQIKQDIPLGSGSSVHCSRTPNKERLLCMCYGQFPDRTQVTVIDTHNKLESATIALDVFAVSATSNADASLVFVLKKALRAQDEGVVYAFGRREESSASRYEPAKTLRVRGVWDMVLSPDGSWLYVLALGYSDKTKQEGEARVLVVEARELMVRAEFPVGGLNIFSYQLGLNPFTGRALYVGGEYPLGRFVEFNGPGAPLTLDTGPLPRWHRMGDEQGIWVTSAEKMQYLPAGGTETTKRIFLNGSSPQDISIQGNPGATIYLPQQHKAAMLVTDHRGNVQGKVALIDFAQQRVERVISTGKSGSGGQVVNALGSLAGGILAVMMSEPIEGGGEPERHAQLVSSADGSLVYALNSPTSDVTVIRTADGTVLDRIKVCRCEVLSPTVGIRFIVAHSKANDQNDELTWLNTRSNKVKSQLKLPKERVRATATVVGSSTFVVLTSRALLLWDSDSGDLMHRTGDLGDPIGIFGTDIASVTTLPIWDAVSRFSFK